jgi:hypothetical protein
MNITSTDKAFDGLNLFVLAQYNRTNMTTKTYFLIICDMQGKIILSKSFLSEKSPDVFSAEFINSTTIMFADSNGLKFWNIYDDTIVELNFTGHHEYEYNPLNNTIFTFNVYAIVVNGTLYAFDLINEYNMSGDLIWSLDTRSFISIAQMCPYNDSYGVKIIDVTHSNTIFFDAVEDVIYYNARNINTFFKIDHKTGKIPWGLGEYGNFTLFNNKGIQQEALFYHPHAIEKIFENTFILFDNDFHNQTNLNNKRSQIVEITIDESTMSANESWSWTAPPEYYSRYWGDADRLPNGNRLGTFGSIEHFDAEIGARLVEVNDARQIVWELNFPATDDYYYGIYRLERIHFSPILNSPQDKTIVQSDDLIISWEYWYNYRNKYEINGSYKLFLDGILIKNGIIRFNQFWVPSKIKFNLGKLNIGIHNLTLILMDEGNHSTIDNMIVIVNSFVRTPNDDFFIIEQGLDNNSLNWRGLTNNSLTCNIYLNSTLSYSFTWNGSFNLNLNSLGNGLYNISLNLINGSVSYYRESFWVKIYPSATPIIMESPNNLSIHWNDAIILSWKLIDWSPSSWNILVNGTLYSYGNWQKGYYYLNYTLPILFEGIYNITLVIVDFNNLKTISSLFLTVLPPLFPIIIVDQYHIDVQWEQINVSLEWEVHGGYISNIWRNGLLIQSGLIKDNQIELRIHKWRLLNWLPGTYNILIEVFNQNNQTSFVQLWLNIIVIFGDKYSNALVSDKSLWYSNGENALGIPDGNFSIIFSDYGNGYLTLDMGFNEEIINNEGADFSIIAQGGNYSIWVANELNKPFVKLGNGQGNQSFDLSDQEIELIRYVRIEYRSGDPVELDAIIAIHCNLIQEDFEEPQILKIEDFNIRHDENNISLTWEVFDATPWNYSVLINDNIIIQSGPWNGSDIFVTFNWSEKGIVKATLLLYDAFGNFNNDTVLIERISSSITTTPISTDMSESVSTEEASSIGYPLSIFHLLALICLYILRRRMVE